MQNVFFFSIKKKDKQLCGDNVDLHQSFSASLFSAQPLKYWCSSSEEKLFCRWWKLVNLTINLTCLLEASSFPVHCSVASYTGQ